MNWNTANDKRIKLVAFERANPRRGEPIEVIASIELTAALPTVPIDFMNLEHMRC